MATEGPSREPCARCGLTHAPGELFVPFGGRDHRGNPILVDTCELEAARAAAHAEPQPPGAVAYHATRHPEEALEGGLDPSRASSSCKHVCLAETAGIAAGVDVGGVVLEVDVSGLDLYFELGEARHHGSVISPERLRVLDPQPAPNRTGWSDPGWRRNHSDCIALRDYPLSRRRLNTAEQECLQRWPFDPDALNDDRLKAVLAELDPHQP